MVETFDDRIEIADYCGLLKGLYMRSMLEPMSFRRKALQIYHIYFNLFFMEIFHKSIRLVDKRFDVR